MPRLEADDANPCESRRPVEPVDTFRYLSTVRARGDVINHAEAEVAVVVVLQAAYRRASDGLKESLRCRVPAPLGATIRTSSVARRRGAVPADDDFLQHVADALSVSRMRARDLAVAVLEITAELLPDGHGAELWNCLAWERSTESPPVSTAGG
ncbi:DUF2267 domain-containing protein [Pseudonocardia parietis]|uniref:Uncharacterized protein (DUF2267 family) n=1 Tax=Pseudonocardia parietis TaxID=570936 RepID=A0ABS4VVF2_9PSEU|nr:DUF2267 domain-containing protein [Pseudonocardia parietis]MBP2367881.1 uncharacterized protein (DUF2267 family) [Pseudonocardia parietis]